MPTDDVVPQALVPVALNGAKAWKEARAAWASRPRTTPWERAFAAEAHLSVGDCETASQLVRDLTLPAAAALWLAALREEIAKVARAQKAVGPPHTLSQLGKLPGARLFAEAETLLAAKPARTAADDLLLADILYRHGEFGRSVALAETLIRRAREFDAAEQDKLRRLLRNGGRRVSEEPSGRGALLWAFRHPVLASVRERAQAKGSSQEDLACLLDLSRLLGVGDLFRDAASAHGYLVSGKLTALFGQAAFSRADLRLLLGAASERTEQENHEVASALIATNRVELVPDVFPDVFPEPRAVAPWQAVDAYALEPLRASIGPGDALLRLLGGAPAQSAAEPRWTAWLFSPGPQRRPVRVRIADAADPAVAIEADADGVILHAYALGASQDGVPVLPDPRMRRLAVVLPAGRSSQAAVRLDLPDREPADAVAAAPEPEAAAPVGDEAGGVVGARPASPGRAEPRRSGQRPPPALQVRHYARAKRFDELARLGATIDPDDAAEPETLLSLVDAYANVACPDAVRRLITGAVIGPHHARYDIAVLLRLYAFEALLPRPVTGILRTTILARLDAFDGTPERLLHLAHQAMRHGDWELVVKARSRAHELAGPTPEHQARLDIQEAQLAFLSGDFSGQLRALNRAIGRHGLAPLAPIDAGRPVSAANLLPEAPRTIEGDLPRVSVIMTMFNRERMLPHAARSILGQSYRELELVLVDDGSEDGTLKLAHEIAAQDPRVRVVALDVNSGAYVARNEGLRACQGEFVTCQDSDDFAHPEKLETAIRYLLLHDAPLATTVKHVRCNDGEGFKSRVGYIRKDFSSLLFRRRATLERVGYFDCGRAGADAEFQIRMRRIAGEDSIVDLPHLASVVDAGAQTLTSGGRFAMDDDQGVMSPQRNAYRRSFLRWHASTADLRLDYPQARRPFEIV